MQTCSRTAAADAVLILTTGQFPKQERACAKPSVLRALAVVSVGSPSVTATFSCTSLLFLLLLPSAKRLFDVFCATVAPSASSRPPGGSFSPRTSPAGAGMYFERPEAALASRLLYFRKARSSSQRCPSALYIRARPSSRQETPPADRPGHDGPSLYLPRPSPTACWTLQPWSIAPSVSQLPARDLSTGERRCPGLSQSPTALGLSAPRPTRPWAGAPPSTAKTPVPRGPAARSS